jgi:hypothetical protein
MKLENKKNNFISLFIILMLISTSLSLVFCVSGEGVDWEAQITINDTPPSDFVIFGEASTARDGPPSDNYDTPKSPMPPSPYVYAYFDDGLEYPNNRLTSDYRHFCDAVEKQWNLTLQWDLLSYPASINLTWSISDLSSSPYDSIYLRNGEGIILADMLSVELYAFTVSSMSTQHFLITCENATCDGSDDGQGNLGDDDDDTSDNSDGTGGNGGVTPDDDDDVSPGGNQPPTPHITVNNLTGLTGSIFYFSGKDSSDDGLIQSYEWDLGNGLTKSGVNITAVYDSPGEYTVTLTVVDDQGISASDSIQIQVVTGNLPPTIAITGPDKGKQNLNYTFSIELSDPNENDEIRYVLDWGDESTKLISNYTDQKTIMLNHSWDSYGLYTLSIYAEDQDFARSSTKYFNFSVDVLPVHGEIAGYLYDDDSDGEYDGFYVQEEDKNVDITQKTASMYSFQLNNKEYEINTTSSTSYSAINNQSSDGTDQSPFSFNGIFVFIVLIIIIIIGLIIYLIKYS